jgi:hypothetical protein
LVLPGCVWKVPLWQRARLPSVGQGIGWILPLFEKEG